MRGSQQIALDIKPPFKEYYFIDIDGNKVAELNKIVANRPEAHVVQGICNERLLTDVFPKVNKENYHRGLCLLDPYGLSLKREIIETAGKTGSIEIFLNFPVMDMRRNVPLSNPKEVTHENIKRMGSFWGTHPWKDIAYYRTQDLFGESENIPFFFK